MPRPHHETTISPIRARSISRICASSRLGSLDEYGTARGVVRRGDVGRRARGRSAASGRRRRRTRGSRTTGSRRSLSSARSTSSVWSRARTGPEARAPQERARPSARPRPYHCRNASSTIESKRGVVAEWVTRTPDRRFPALPSTRSGVRRTRSDERRRVSTRRRWPPPGSRVMSPSASGGRLRSWTP